MLELECGCNVGTPTTTGVVCRYRQRLTGAAYLEKMGRGRHDCERRSDAAARAEDELSPGAMGSDRLMQFVGPMHNYCG